MKLKVATSAILLQGALVVLATVASVVLMHNIGFLTQMERFVGDLRIATLLRPEPQSPDIVIAGITEDTLKQFEYRSPVDREFLANLLKTLDARQPRAIGLDVLFDQPTDAKKDALLKQTIENLKTPLVISYTSNPDIVDKKQFAYLNDFVPPRDRVAAEIASDAFGTARWIWPGSREADGSFMLGFARGILAKIGIQTPDAEPEMAWHGRPNAQSEPFRIFPAHLVAMLPPDWFKGKIVLIGAIVSLTDRHRTPFASVYAGNLGDIPGIEIHAHSIAQLLEGRRPHNRGLPTELAIVLLVSAVGAALGSASKLPVAPRIGIGAAFIALLWISGGAIFYFTEISIVLVSPTIGFVFSMWGADMLTGRQARRQREFIQSAFSRYVSPKVVDRLVSDPTKLTLEGESREMTFLFTDLEGFTTLSEKVDSRALAQMLNAYLDGVCAVILSLEGMVDKFIGDAVFAIFNGPTDQPDHAERTVQCALAIDKFSETFRAEQHAKGIALGVTRIGVHSGRAVIGNFGSHTRMQYTALGDAVNTASRLEGVNKYFGTRICISETTRSHCTDIPFRPVAVIAPKGKTELLGIYEPLTDARANSPYMMKYVEAYGLAEQKDPAAAPLFEQLHEEMPDDRVVGMHLERLHENELGVEMVMHDK